MNRDAPEPIDEQQPIPGSSRSRVSLAFGLFILLLIVGFFVWFIISFSQRGDPAGMLG